MSTLSLDRVQRWMQGIIVHPGSVAEAVRTRTVRATAAVKDTGEVILPSPTLSPEERLEIYHGQYPMRMRDALAGDYPGLEH